MAECYYEPTPATDGASMNPVPGAVFQVFELSDTGFTTPLSLRVGAGNPAMTVAASESLATLPGVWVTSPNFEHIWVSGSFRWRRDSIDGAKAAIQDAKVAAVDAAASSDSSAQSSAVSAQAAQAAAALVDAPADTVLANLAGNPASQFATQLSATITEQIESSVVSVVSPAELLVKSLDMRENRALTVVLAGDSTSDSHTEWFEIAWREALRDFWPERPARLYAWNNTTNAHDAVETWQTGNGTLPTLTAYNNSVAGSTLAAQRTHFAGMFPTKPDLLLISHGHNYTTPAADYLADIDAFVAEFRATYPGVPVACLSQNPEFTTGAKTQAEVDLHAARQLALRSHCIEKGYGYIPTWEAFAKLGDFGQSLINADGVHPTPAATSAAVVTGGRLQADVAKDWIAGQTLRSTLLIAADIGVPGYDHLYQSTRFNAAGAEPSAGAVIHSWWDQGAPHETIGDAAGTSGGGTVTDESGVRFLRINTPPAAAMGAAWANNSTNPRTMGYVFRSAQLTINFIQAVGYRVRRITGGAWELSNGTETLTTPGTDGWTFIMVVQDGARSMFRVNDVEVAATTAFAPGAISPTGITIGTGSGSDYAPFDYAGIASWPRALTKSERDTVHSLMRAKYPVLP